MNRSVRIFAGTRPDANGAGGKKHGPERLDSVDISSNDGVISLLIEGRGKASGGISGGVRGISYSETYPVMRFGEAQMDGKTTLGLFECALDGGMKLSKPETQRLLSKIIQASEIFD